MERTAHRENFSYVGRKLLSELLHNADRVYIYVCARVMYVCVCVHVLAIAKRISLYERTCVKGPSRKRTFQVVAEMQLCAMMWPR